MNRPRDLDAAYIPMVPAVSLDRYQDIIKYARYLEESIVTFRRTWLAMQPYASRQEQIDAHNETRERLLELGEEIDKLEEE